MNKKLSYNITENITAYNNIDIDLGLSFDPLSYVVDMPDNMKKYINENMLLMNIEDVDSIYNIFDHRRVSYAYQMSNMLFINSDQNIFPLNYNLETLSYFTISYNNIGLNLMPKSLVGVNNFNHQTIFAYNSPNNSYIYSNDDKLVSISYVSQGVYKIDEDNIKLVNNELSINTTKYKYNHSNINTFINKTNNVIKQYDNNEGITIKYDNGIIEVTDRNVSINKKIKNQEENNFNFDDITIKDTNYFIIDIPLIYEYETHINNSLDYNRRLCPIDIHNNIDINIPDIFNNYISIDYNKSFIHNNKCLSIKFDENGKATMKDSCNVSLYFNVDIDIYNYVYNLENLLNNQFNLIIKIFNLTFNFNCWIDVMNKLFKNLYHNYNYGFNFDKHGKCVGLLILPKSSDSLITTKSENDTIDKVNENREKRGDYTKSKFKKKDLSDINYINVNNSYINLFDYNSSILTKNKVKNVNKDVFINFDLESFENVFMTNQKIDFNFSNEAKLGETETFDRILTFNYNNITHGLFENPGTLKYPEQLKKRDLNFIYKKYSDTIHEDNPKYPTINKYNATSNLYLNMAFLDTRYGTLKLSECITKDENNNNDTYKIINNYFVLDYKKHDIIFNDVYNYRKVGFLKGDFYTPCVQDYLLMNLFNVKNYLTYNIYKKYVKYFNENNVRFLTNQFKEKNGQIFQYVLDVNNVDEYRLNFYYDREGDDPTKKKCIWPIFRIPDYSIINSNDYIIIYSNKENCEYIDYYISTLERTTTIYINCRVYFKTDNLNLTNFEIYNEDFEKITYIKITEANLIDRNNDIYQLAIYIEPSHSEISVIEKMNKFYICFEDSEPYLNHKKINDDTYRRILCKVYVKNDGI